MNAQRVIFYREPVEPDYLLGGDILAVFPDQPYKPNFDATVCCYTAMGQHSGLCPQYLDYCKLATREEYKDLELELTCLGYSLNVLNLSLENPLNI
jgi:hypothetical protein